MSNTPSKEFMTKDNPKYIDLLEEDSPIAGQKFVCLSFVSPEKIIRQREHFYFEQFIKQYDLTESIKRFSHFLHFISYKYNLEHELLTQDLNEFVLDEKDKLATTELNDSYKNFVDTNEEKLDEAFNHEQNFQTSMRGLKVRGVFPTQEEAELRCKMIREVDPNHDVFVGPVGLWLPWDPEAYKTQKVEYMEETLNQLMHEKQKNETEAKQNFEKRLKETKRKAIEENIENARASGNKLTQTINKDGNLVTVGDSNTTVNELTKSNSVVTDRDISKELFEGDNIVMDKDSDHGLGDILAKMKRMGPVTEEKMEEVD